MHITAEHGDQHVTLHLRGEFDTFYCADLEKEVAAIQVESAQLQRAWIKNQTELVTVQVRGRVRGRVRLS